MKTEIPLYYSVFFLKKSYSYSALYRTFIYRIIPWKRVYPPRSSKIFIKFSTIFTVFLLFSNQCVSTFGLILYKLYDKNFIIKLMHLIRKKLYLFKLSQKIVLFFRLKNLINFFFQKDTSFIQSIFAVIKSWISISDSNVEYFPH